MKTIEKKARDELLKRKEAVHNMCIQSLADQEKMLMDEMENLRKSSEFETKSSAGDKYETGRAMINLEKEKISSGLTQVRRNLEILNSINTAFSEKEIRPGSLVFTSQSTFYISIGLGKLKTMEPDQFFAISPVSPLGKELLSKTSGDSIVINNKPLIIKTIC